MAQGIDVPGVQTPIVPYQAPNPLPFVSQALDRNQQASQFAVNSIGNLGEILNQYHQQRIQNQLNALKAYSDIAGTSGITAANQLAPNIPGMGNTQNLPTDPFAQFQDPNSPPAPPQPGTPGNATFPPAPLPPATAGTAGSGGAPVLTPQDTSPSQAIALSAQAGHPVNPGLAAFHAPQPVQPGVQDPNAPPSLPTLAAQMAQNNALIQQASHVGGSYAGNLVKNLSAVNTGLAAQDTAMQAPVKFAQDQANFQQTQKREADQFASSQANEKNKTIASEVSKQGPDSQQISDLQTLAQTMQKSLGSDLGVLGNVKGDLYQISGGRKGSEQAASLQNSTIPLATGLNTVLSHRFNAGEVAALGKSLIPQPRDTPQYQQQKLQNLSTLLNVMATGNEKNVKDVAAAVMSGAIPNVGTPQTQTPAINSQVQYDALPNGAPYTFKGQPHIKGKS